MTVSRSITRSLSGEGRPPAFGHERSTHPRQRRRRFRAGERSAGYVFLLPWLLGLFVLTLGPMAYSLYLSFTDFDLLTPPEWLGVGNYQRMLQDDRYLQALKVTLLFVATSVPLKLAISLLVAALLNKGIAALDLYRAVYYVPSMIGGSVAIAIMWRQIFGSDGLINQVLAWAGIDGPSWVSNPSYALYTLVLLGLWQFGAPMIIFLAGLRQIPQELYDASSVDGAGSVAKFFRITVPLITPLIFFNLIMQTIWSMQQFNSAYIISDGSGGPVDSTLFYTLYLYQEAFTNFRMGYASAMAWTLLLIIAFFTAVNFLGARKWVHYEDVGGR